jgi:light-regulated signal transduction histidine kinase (bacteriophytochrome)
VRTETQRMGALIDDLLKLSKISRSEMKLEEVDLTRLAQGVVRRLEESSPGRQASFVIEPNLSVHGDIHFLEVAFTNLLGNAYKFTSQTVGAKIEFGRTTQNGAQVFFVRDNGAGFDMTYAHKLFNAFQRMHSQSEFPGNGVGLAMVKRIVNLHHGRIWVETRVDHGATFFFTLSDQRAATDAEGRRAI